MLIIWTDLEMPAFLMALKERPVEVELLDHQQLVLNLFYRHHGDAIGGLIFQGHLDLRRNGSGSQGVFRPQNQ